MKIPHISHILEGINNSIFVKEQVEKIANARNEICRTCPLNSINAKKTGLSLLRPDVHCLDCLCSLYVKQRSLSSECPQGKWNAIATEQEDELIDQALSKNEK